MAGRREPHVFIFILLSGEIGGKCVMHHNALRRCVWDSSKACQWVYIHPLNKNALRTYPLKPPYTIGRGHIPLSKVHGWTCFRVEITSYHLS